MKFYVIAGEASGDLHASNLVKALKQLEPAVQFRGFGGDLMKNAGVELVTHYRETAFMGFWEVIKNLKTILSYIDLCKKDVLNWRPDAIILIDYPGFNLRIAEFAHKNSFKVFYYISPQVWAWKSSRVKKIKRDVAKMFVILPFEKDFYKKWNYDVEFVGHPLLDELKDIKTADLRLKTQKPVIALLPGSRKQEIARMLPIMLEVVNDFPDHQFVVGAVNSVEENFYRSIIGNKNCEIVFDKTYSLLSLAKAALVTSGTATMETALFNVPQVVCYKGSGLSYFIARRIVDVKYIAMVNLIVDRPLVKELIQQELNYSNLKSELNKILFDEPGRKEIQDGYKELKEKLGGAGASEKTAKKILELLINK
ncbi:MAG TPA: lipid-A-disaccharide synthase [Chitinophagales bacterium]|nr:lipid-A-disaccharide synthase [Chitinophagales bacterium]